MSNPENRFGWEPEGFVPTSNTKKDIVLRINDVLAEQDIPIVPASTRIEPLFEPEPQRIVQAEEPNGRYSDVTLLYLFAQDNDLVRGEKRLARSHATQATLVAFEALGTTTQAVWGTAEAFAGRPGWAIALGVGTVVAGGVTAAQEYFRRSTKAMRNQMRSMRQRKESDQS